MRAKTILLAASSLAILASATGAAAQTALRIGATVQGQLSANDPMVEGDADGAGAYRYEDYSVRLRAGQRFEAVMRSEAFDTYLELFVAGDTTESLASDDDGLGEGTNSRLRFTPTAAGDYTLRARTFSGTDGGDFSLTARERPRSPRAPRPRPITVGAEVSGVLDDRDPELDSGAHYDAYAFRAAEGQRFAISLNSDAFDPVLQVGRMAGGEFTETASNDDGPSRGLNSYLVFTAPSAGEYVVRATPLVDTGAGAYTLALADGPAPRAAQAVAVGDTVDGSLTAEDGSNDQGLRSDAYRFTGRAGQIVTATLSSDAFDTYLALYGPDDGSTPLAEDDDGAGEGTNSRLSFTLPSDGDYLIEARGFSDDATGDYKLELVETPPPPPPAAVVFGETVQGALTDEDGVDAEGRKFDAYSVTLQAGQRIQAIMRSGDFDTYLEVASTAEPYTALASDDDGLQQGTDSRLNFTATEAGDYVVRALPLSAENDGLYSLQIIDRGPEPTPGSIIVGATARGSLTDADAIAPEGGYYDAYTIQAKKDEKLVITLVSNDFDALIEVGRTNEAGEWESLASDDDSLSDTHARLEWTPDADGAYELRARSFAPASMGDYALMVERKPAV
ncbi:peptidase [Brevundimonas sp. Leaf363]|uniref:PPC domain-containing protein n=1 Tax=Brevundimonas sp. Leaf363 TaxID=1736353 RepID=UPI0006FBD1EE|nr:PPC domain-containing protein [Brevundimonas sp. Leaf363]KQS54303.1 peptidase [Brevundimonas sp. Leaf363]